MKSYLLLMPMILATSAALGGSLRTSPPSPADAQTQAAGLLSRPQAFAMSKVDGPLRSLSLVSASTDAQAQAAALLSRRRQESTVDTDIPAGQRVRMLADAQAQAAALLKDVVHAKR